MANLAKLVLALAFAASLTIPNTTPAASETAPVEQAAIQDEPANERAAEPPYIKRLPASGPLQVVVLGDSLADGLYAGLYRLNRDNKNLTLKKASKVNTGLVRSDRYDWNKGAKRLARSGKYDVAVVLLGLNDLQTFRGLGKARHFSQKGWEKEYRKRIDTLISDLKAANLAVYWVGIPITSPKRYQKEYAYLNGFFREAAEKHGLRYVDTWTGLADSKGKYTPFWRDADGKRKQIRMRDGVHFTPDGYMIFASFLNDLLTKDIAAAKSQQASK